MQVGPGAHVCTWTHMFKKYCNDMGFVGAELTVHSAINPHFFSFFTANRVGWYKMGYVSENDSLISRRCVAGHTSNAQEPLMGTPWGCGSKEI